MAVALLKRRGIQVPMIPRPLRAVALVQLVVGVLSVAGTLWQLTQHRVILDFGVLGIPICFGLMGLRAGWRTCALTFLWIDFILGGIVFTLGFVTPGPVSFGVFGARPTTVSPVWLCIVVVPMFALALWQYRVLTRPDIRALFASGRMRAGSAADEAINGRSTAR
jgi:hypothetical protein